MSIIDAMEILTGEAFTAFRIIGTSNTGSTLAEWSESMMSTVRVITARDAFFIINIAFRVHVIRAVRILQALNTFSLNVTNIEVSMSSARSAIRGSAGRAAVVDALGKIRVFAVLVSDTFVTLVVEGVANLITTGAVVSAWVASIRIAGPVVRAVGITGALNAVEVGFITVWLFGKRANGAALSVDAVA
jgi:hypothetical protein